MSADLFAAFGPNKSSEKASNNQSENNTGPATSPTVLIPRIETLVIEKQHDLYQNPSKPKQEDKKSLWRQDAGGTDVLFDATEDTPQVDDDFGDFEDALVAGENHTMFAATYLKQESTMLPISSNMSIHDLLGLDQEDSNPTGPKVTPSPRPPSVNTFFTSNAKRAASTISAEDDWGGFSAPATYDASISTRNTSTTTQQLSTQISEIEQDSTEDDWDAFEYGETEPSTHAQAEGPPSDLAAAAVPQLPPPPMSSSLSQRTDARAAEAIRPSNIPPPAILLQLLPGVFDELRQTVTTLVRQNPLHPSKLPQRDIAPTITQAFTVAARIIAGRTLRWKRDAILSQSMRIGPAATTGGGRGMKLAAINKSESLKEEKEAADVVRAWEISAHLFNSTVSKAGIQRPLMALYLSVRPRLTSGVDVFKASHACALCGINRDERVPQVEASVEDSFGEYWTEHWGHRDCRNFWITYKDRLHQR